MERSGTPPALRRFYVNLEKKRTVAEDGWPTLCGYFLVQFRLHDDRSDIRMRCGKRLHVFINTLPQFERLGRNHLHFLKIAVPPGIVKRTQFSFQSAEMILHCYFFHNWCLITQYLKFRYVNYILTSVIYKGCLWLIIAQLMVYFCTIENYIDLVRG